MGKHAVPAGPEGRALRRELRARRRAGAWRFGVDTLPFMIASGSMDQTDVSWLLHPFLIVFGAVLPMTAIAMLATKAVNAVGERRARRLAKPRPRLTYLFLALGWAVAAVVFRLLGWAASGGPDGAGDWIVTATGWSFMISACAAFMMITRAITAGNYRRPAWLARLHQPRSQRGVRPAIAGLTPHDDHDERRTADPAPGQRRPWLFSPRRLRRSHGQQACGCRQPWRP